MKSVFIGGLVWLALWVVPLNPNFGIGTIEKLFLLGPLVVIPLGLELLGAPGGGALPAAILTAAAFFLERGWLAATLTIPWLIVVALAGIDGLRRLIGGAW